MVVAASTPKSKPAGTVLEEVAGGRETYQEARQIIFRPTMQGTCRSLRSFATPKSPLLLMTATLRVDDMQKVARALDIHSSPVVIHASPVHN